MITNSTQLQVAMHQLTSFQQMLEAMRSHLQDTNPSLFPVLSEGYLVRIKQLEEEVIGYLRESPTESPLMLDLSGSLVRPGVIKATLAGQLIAGLQSALYRVGASIRAQAETVTGVEQTEPLRLPLQLNLIATGSSSFILAMDLAPQEQLVLYKELNMATAAVHKLIQHIEELHRDAYTGDRPTLRALRKIGALTKKGVEKIEIIYKEDNTKVKAVFTPTTADRIDSLLSAPKEGERTVSGTLIEINIEDNTCKVHPDNQVPVDCAYDEALEEDLIAALKHRVEMAGQFIELEWPGRYRITKIERFKTIPTEEED